MINMTEELRAAVKHYAKVMKVSESEAKSDAEQMIKMNMADNPSWSKDFAVASWVEETMDMTMEEIDEADKIAKANKPKMHARSMQNPFTQKVERVRKPNDAKRAIVEYLAGALAAAQNGDNDIMSGITAIATTNIERQIDFVIDNRHFSITLTEHRAPKADK